MTDGVLAASRSEIAELFDVERAAEESGSGVIEDPFPIWADLRARAPVHRGNLAECMSLPAERGGVISTPAMPFFSVFSFAAVNDVFTRKDDFSSEILYDIQVVEKLGDSILSMDGLRHRRYRNVVQAVFQPDFARGWWRTQVIEPIVAELIADIEGEDGVDLNARLFARLPMQTMTSGFGMSIEDGLKFRRHMLAAFTFPVSAEDVAGAVKRAGAIVAEIVAERRRAPKDDLISRLAHADLLEDDGSARKMNDEEIASFCRLIMFAGGETTWRQLGTAFFSLLNHPDQLDSVRNDRSLLPNAILESFRLNPDPLFLRKVKRDTILHGMKLPAGAGVHVCIAAANRDPARWDEPDMFDIHRPVQRSLAFAAGAHSCLGQHVARQEIDAALNALMDRFPNIRWDHSQPQAKLTGGLVHRGPGPLHVLLH